MALRVKRQSDQRVIKAILHRLADIPGGVTIDVSTLGGSRLHEATPIAVGADGKYNVVKTAKLVANVNNTATDYPVAKGHHFKVGDFFAAATGAKAYAITAIDKNTHADKDIITVGTTIGVAYNAGHVFFEAAAESAATTSAYKHSAIAIVGEHADVEVGENLFTSAWLVAVVKTANAGAPFTSAIQSALKSIVFI